MAARAFFRGGLGGTLLGRPGWAVVRVEDAARGYLVRARYTAEPAGCPRCGRAAPDGTLLYRHGAKATQVRDRPRHGRPVLVVVTHDDPGRREHGAATALDTGRPMPTAGAFHPTQGD